MKLVVELLIVAHIAMCSGDPVDVNTEEKDSGFHFTQEMCPTSEAELLYSIVIEVGNQCIKTGSTNATSFRFAEKKLEDFRDFFAGFCQKKPRVRQCLLETTAQIETCHHETFLTSFKIYRDMIETGLEFGCGGGGDRLASLVYELASIVSTKRGLQMVNKCSEKFEVTVKIIARSDVDMSTKLYNLHKVMTTFAECVEETELNLLKLSIDEVLPTMKCVDPRDGLLIPCGQIDPGSINVTSVCDLKTHGANMSLYDMLEEEFVDFQNSDSEIIGDDQVRNMVGLECKFIVDLPYFYNMTRIISDICLNATQQNEFLLLGDVIKSGSEAACHGNGTLLEALMIGVYRAKNSGHGHAVWECVAAVRSARNESDGHGSFSKNLRFYHELEAFKGCLVNKLGGDVTSVDSATTLIDLTLKAAKCVHPEDGATVLCETLVVKT